jgi:hypothetical protein
MGYAIIVGIVVLLGIYRLAIPPEEHRDAACSSWACSGSPSASVIIARR